MRALILLAVCTLSLVAGCDDADEHRARLTGTWQRDIELQDGKGCAILVLERKGNFTERLYISDSNGTAQTIEYGGQWLTNGSSFTLRYLRENGRQYGGGIVRFLTLQLTSVTSEEFVGRDERQSRDVIYHRANGAQCESSPQPSIERTASSRLRRLEAAAHVERLRLA